MTETSMLLNEQDLNNLTEQDLNAFKWTSTSVLLIEQDLKRFLNDRNLNTFK